MSERPSKFKVYQWNSDELPRSWHILIGWSNDTKMLIGTVTLEPIRDRRFIMWEPM